MKRTAGIVILVLALMLTGCGSAKHSPVSSTSSTGTSSSASSSTSSTTTTATTTAPNTQPPPIWVPSINPDPGHPCTAGDYYMQCAATTAPTVSPPTLPPVSVNQIGFGIDFAYGGPPASVLRANGARFGASYLSDSSKDWPGYLVQEYRAAGLGVVFVWEQAAARPLDGYAAGYDDARDATEEVAERYGLTHGVHVDFAADFDSTPYGARIVSYYQGAQAWMNHLNHVYGDGDSSGAYGGRNTVEQVCRYHAGTLNWQTVGWSGGERLGPPCVVLYQASINHYWLGHYSADYDYALAPNYGESNFTSPVQPTICFGRHAQNSLKCRVARTEYSADVHVVAAARALYTHHGCPKLESVRLILDQRYTWFRTHLAKHPKVRTAHRRKALYATGHALSHLRVGLSRSSCSTLQSKISEYAAKAAALEKRYT